MNLNRILNMILNYSESKHIMNYFWNSTCLSVRNWKKDKEKSISEFVLSSVLSCVLVVISSFPQLKSNNWSWNWVNQTYNFCEKEHFFYLSRMVNSLGLVILTWRLNSWLLYWTMAPVGYQTLPPEPEG